MWNEFKKFAMRGNVIDLAVAVVVGNAFNRIVGSLVDDMLMPVIGILVGRLDLSGLQLRAGDVVLRYGMFLQTVVDFLIVAFTVFMLVRVINRAKAVIEREEAEKAAAQAAESPPPPPREQVLLEEIRDLLKELRDRQPA
ncbi:MAG: large-conductance mechanosensitive channel protein MscL [Bacillota bacterium]|nr:large conductance mechanosensitive channel protein MscL [Bacillota bacterium]